jgi:lactate racemase
MTIAAIAETGTLSDDTIRDTLWRGLGDKFLGQRLLVLIPDHTRTLPLPSLFHMFVEVLHGATRVDFMVALGTHPPLDANSLNRLVGIDAEERSTQYQMIGLLNHDFEDPRALCTLGVMDGDEVREIAGDCWHPSLPEHIEIRINRVATQYDHILILGPTFPHEVAGFSGGLKYLFPGISGREMIDATHWLGALSGVVGTIGIKDTPVRAMIHAAARRLTTPVTLVALIVEGEALSGLFIGDPLIAWSEAADLSAQRHIRWCERPFNRVLSCAPAMYDELWTAAKAMYKLEPAIALGGEVVVYAPHLDEISRVHGKFIRQVGYHILPYLLANWDRFQGIPLGVLAHSAHLRGSGIMENGIEKPNVSVVLASRISAEECARLNLGYLDPAAINMQDWRDQEGNGILVVPRAGELLFRVRH